MTHNNQAVAHHLLTQMWTQLGGDAELARNVSFTGEGSMPSAFALTDLAAAAFGVVGVAVGELLKTAGEPVPHVAVDRVLASGWWRLPAGPSHVLGTPVNGSFGPHRPFMTEVPTADGRWLRLHGTFPTQKTRLCQALGVDEDVDQVAEIVATCNADEIEQRLVDAGAVVSVSRTTEEWLASPAGRAIDAEPLAALTEYSADGNSWRPTPRRPLAGLKVLDLTRVIAGPMGTRLLASLGAEVLRIDRPGSDESETPGVARGAEMVLGKRWAFLDLRTSDGLAQFKALLAESDILVHGYRPGALDGFLSEEERREIKPDLIEVAIRAYGWEGPWSGRRGFDTIVQFSTGLAVATQEWALQDPEHRVPLSINGAPVDASRPRHTVVEGLDLTTGHLVAAAAIRGLTRRLQDGVGSSWKLSLARTASLVIKDANNDDPGPKINIPLDGPWEDRIYATTFGPAERLVQPMQIENVPLFWERPAERAGASTPTWSS